MDAEVPSTAPKIASFRFLVIGVLVIGLTPELSGQESVRLLFRLNE